MTTTSFQPPSFLQQNNEVYSTFSTKNGPLTSVTVARIMPTLTVSDSSTMSTAETEAATATTKRNQYISDIAEEALRLTRETLKDKSYVPQESVKAPKAAPSQQQSTGSSSGLRLNKFVRRLHDMLQSEQGNGVVEWRRGLLVLHSTDVFAKQILPKYFNTRNFKTFRRQLNYYGFVHVRSFSTTGSATTALWVNQSLAEAGSEHISSVLMLKRVEPCDSAKTAEGRRIRKEHAIHMVEEDLGVCPKALQRQQIARLGGTDESEDQPTVVPSEIRCSSRHSSRSSSTGELSDTTMVSETVSTTTKATDKKLASGASAANLLLLLSRAPFQG